MKKFLIVYCMWCATFTAYETYMIVASPHKILHGVGLLIQASFLIYGLHTLRQEW